MNTKDCRVCHHAWTTNNFYATQPYACKTCWDWITYSAAVAKRKVIKDQYGSVAPWLIEQAIERKAQVYKQRIKDMAVATPGPLPTPCLIWQGCESTYPKIMVSIDGVTGPVGAHRLALSLALGHELGFLEASHLCHRPLCVNAQHLVAETRQQNLARKGK